MTKRVNNAVAETVDMSVVNEVVAETVATADVPQSDDTATEDEVREAELSVKAAQILRLKMPNLSANGLNFEKRTGNFFRATLVKEEDKNGEPIIDEATGLQKERVARIVVSLTGEDGQPTKEAVQCADEIEIKRAAGRITRAEDERKKKIDAIKEAEKALLEANEAYVEFENAFMAAAEKVEAFILPEKETTVRVAKTKQLEEEVLKKAEENAKLRALLIAAGIDPDNV